MILEIRLFGGLACNNRNLPCCGQNEFYLDVAEGTTVQGLRDLLNIRSGPLLMAINGVMQKKDFKLADKDRVGIFPPIAGG